MKAEYVQRGESIDYLNAGEKTISAGDVVVLGKRAGVAGCDIAPGALGSVHVVGVFSATKAAASTEIKIGDEVFYSEEGAAATGEVKLGWAVEASDSGVETVLVKL